MYTSKTVNVTAVCGFQFRLSFSSPRIVRFSSLAFPGLSVPLFYLSSVCPILFFTFPRFVPSSFLPFLGLSHPHFYLSSVCPIPFFTFPRFVPFSFSPFLGLSHSLFYLSSVCPAGQTEDSVKKTLGWSHFFGKTGQSEVPP